MRLQGNKQSDRVDEEEEEEEERERGMFTVALFLSSRMVSISRATGMTPIQRLRSVGGHLRER